MKKKSVIKEDAETMAMIEAYERGEFVPVPNQKKFIAMAQQAAANYRLKKVARINIRLAEKDLEGLKARAEEEGLPYQTLIASVLHKYNNGRLVDR